MRKIFSLVLCAFLALSSIAVMAQSISGDLVGTVKDGSGAVVPGAKVTITNTATGVTSSTLANASGEYHLTNLPAGKYDISTVASGFEPSLLKGFDVDVAKVGTANVTLSVAGQATKVEVTAEAAVSIDTTTAQLQQTFSEKELQDLPTATIGLGVLNLALLSPGVTTSGGVGAGTGPAVGGQRPRNNNFTIEGIDNNNKSVTGPLVYVPNDAVQEFTILTNQFSPEFGHSNGGQFNQVVTSGTNHIHGKAYVYNQNKNYNAIDASTKRAENGPNYSNTRYDNNRYGGQVGGPIFKNKLFFFTNYEQNPIGTVLNAVYCAPTAAGFTAIAGISGLSSTNVQQFTKYVSPAATEDVAQSQCVDPIFVTDPHGKSTYTNYNNQDVPATAIAVGAVPINGSSFSNAYYSTSSIDFTKSDRDSFRFRYIYNRQASLDSAASLPVFWTSIPNRYHLFAGSWFHNFTPSLTNEFRIGFNRYYNATPVGPQAYPGLDMFPNIVTTDLGVQIGPDGNAPQSTIQNLYQVTENISWTKGNHTFKFGFDGRKFISPQSFTQRVRGDYEYLNTDDFFHDLTPTSFGERSTGNFFYYGDQTAFYGYANDNWRVRPDLTLNIGIRYEFSSVPTGDKVESLNSAASVPGLINFHEPKPQYKNFVPRLGFAYSPGGKGTTSIRAGFGMGYDVLYDNLGILSFPPQFSGTQDTTTTPSEIAAAGSGFLANGGIPPGNGQLQTFDSIADQRAATSAYVPDQKLPYALSYTLSVQHVFANDYTAEVRYVGTRGIHLPVQDRLNRQPVVNSSNYLPTYLTAPSQATLDSLPNTLANLEDIAAAGGNFVPAYLNAGFDGNNIVAFEPYGSSNYNGLQTQLTRRFQKGLLINAAYTWSKTMDNSTADVFSTVLTPRRAQDWQNFGADYSRSALDHTNRVTFVVLYDIPFFKHGNFLERNLLGNWQISPIYTLQSGEYATVQSGVDSNLNGDSAGDRTVFNPKGIKGTGSNVTSLKNSNGDVVAYVASNPTAQYIRAQTGALATASRNTLQTPRTNDWDASATKRVSISERYNVEFQAQAFNVFNHPQFVPGSLNQVNSIGYTDSNTTNYLRPYAALFNQPQNVFSSNSRSLQLSAKFIF